MDIIPVPWQLLHLIYPTAVILLLEGERCIATVYGKDLQISTPLRHCRSLSSVLTIGYDVFRRPCKAGGLVNFPLGLISGALSSPEWGL